MSENSIENFREWPQEIGLTQNINNTSKAELKECKTINKLVYEIITKKKIERKDRRKYWTFREEWHGKSDGSKEQIKLKKETYKGLLNNK